MPLRWGWWDVRATQGACPLVARPGAAADWLGPCLQASLGSLSNMGSMPASLSINSVLDPSKLAGEGPGSRQSSIQIRTQPQFRSDSISSSQPQQGMGANPPPSPTPAASQQQANMAALFNPFAVARQQDPLGSSVPLPVVSMLQVSLRGGWVLADGLAPL